MGGHPRTKRVDDLIKLFELDPRKKNRTYSKGNRQKVALIAAFSANVDLYIFDEPTSGLDPLQARNFQDQILALKQAGKTVLLSSHILSEVEKVVDCVAVIRQGRIVEVGSLTDLQEHAALRINAQVQDWTPFQDYPKFHQELNGEISFTVARALLPKTMTALVTAGVTDLKVTPPTLEDLFMQYYDTGAVAHES